MTIVILQVSLCMEDIILHFNKIFIIAVIFIFTSCGLKYNRLFDESKNYVNNRFSGLPTIQLDNTEKVNKENFSIIIISDSHSPKGLINYTKLIDYLTSINTDKRPAFCVNLGDVTNTGLKSDFMKYNEFVAELKKLDIEHFAVPGNHDCFDSGNNGTNFIENLYPHLNSYRIKTSNFSFYFLDTADGTLGSMQFNKFKSLAISDENDKIILTHYPFYYNGELTYKILDSTERLSFLSLCNIINVKYLLCGHTHSISEKDLGNFTEITLSSFAEEPDFLELIFDNITGSIKVKNISL